MGKNVLLRSSTMLAGPVGMLFLAAHPAQAASIWDNVFLSTLVVSQAVPEGMVTAYAPTPTQTPQPIDWDKALQAYGMAYKAPPLTSASQAVDGINGKVDGFGGTLDNRSYWGTKGAFSVPLNGFYGLQIDGAVGKFDNRSFGAVGGHVFWRDPRVGLVGLYGAFYNWDSVAGQVHLGQIAGEGAWYWNRFTVEGVAGVEFGNSVSAEVGNLIESVDIKTRFFDKLNVTYYWTDNFGTYIGHRYLGGKNAAALGAELGVPIPRSTVMASVFVEGRAGDYTGVWGGLRFYMGQHDKSLIRRHREDDPIEWTPEGLGSMSNQSTSSPTAPKCPPDGYGCSTN